MHNGLEVEAECGGTDVAAADHPKQWEIKTLPSIMKMLQHDHVHLLKMDIEASEWETWESWIRSDDNTNQFSIQNKIGQLLGEVHFPASAAAQDLYRRRLSHRL